jgi:uncharacterized tellurite resistance protein B-like protein
LKKLEKPKIMEIKKFYRELGKLIYAIAKADGTIQQEEVDMFRETLRKRLQPLEASMDDFGVDSAFYTELQFEAMLDETTKMDEAFESFMNYVDENKSQFSPEMKEATLLIIKDIAEAYQGIITEEQMLIDKVKAKFESM